MSIEPIAFLPPSVSVEPSGLAGALSSVTSSATSDASGMSFVDWMGAQVNKANGKLIESEQALQDLATGDTSSLHHVMISLEEARLGFQLMTQVRSRLLESYQEVMRMQI